MELLKSWILLAILFELKVSNCRGATVGSPNNSQIFDGPYIQVYPPSELSQDQQSCSLSSSNGTCPLYIALILSFGGDFISSGAVPGVQLALDQINADPTMLPGYSLRYTLTNSNCNRSTALDALTAQLFQPPIKIGVIGGGCSVASEPTAELSHYYNLTQLSCASSSPELSNRERFRNYFQLLASSSVLAYGYFGIIKQFGWRSVSIILQDENLFTTTIGLLQSLLDNEGVLYTERRFRSDGGIESLGENPFKNEDRDVRIFILSMYPTRAIQVLCKAHQHGIRYPRYLFIVLGWYPDGWWIGTEEEQITLNETFGCDRYDREAVLEYTLAISRAEFLTDKDLTSTSVSGINGSEYLSLYSTYVAQSPLNVSETVYSQQCYDATWALAIALNKTVAEFSNVTGLYNNSENEEFGLQQFTYSNSKFNVAKKIFANLEETDFPGITGNVNFDHNGVRVIDTLNVHSYQRIGVNQTLQAVLVGSIEIRDINTVDITFNYSPGYSEQNIWGAAGRPYDGVPNTVTVAVSLVETVIFSVLAAAGIVFAVVCLIFNFIFRNKKLIRLTSPNLNYLIGIGAIILYVDVFFFVIPTTNQEVVAILCNINPWFTALGYSLCYGTILAKMFRVYYIFTNPTPKKKTIKDWMLALGVLMLVMIDLIILVIYTLVEGVRDREHLSAVKAVSMENPEDITGVRDLITNYFIFVCDSKARHITLGILYGYKAVIQVIALIFTFSIRKVKIKGLNDANYIAIAVYVTSIVTAVIIVCTYTLEDFINAYAAVFSCGFIIGTTVILILVFVPKMVNLYIDPQGEKLFKSGRNENMSQPNISQTNLSNINDLTINDTKDSKIESLNMKVKELQAELTAYKVAPKPTEAASHAKENETESGPQESSTL